MSDPMRIRERMRLANYSRSVEKRVRDAQKRAGMELRDNVKALQNVPGYQIRQKGETGERGFVVRKGRKIAASSATRFGGVRSGIEFKKNEINYDVVRSRPGEPPRRQRGLLYSSQTYEVRDTFRGATTRVGPSPRVAKYARAQELGYAPGGLEPRPSLAPAAASYAPTYQELMKRAVEGAKP